MVHSIKTTVSNNRGNAIILGHTLKVYPIFLRYFLMLLELFIVLLHHKISFV